MKEIDPAEIFRHGFAQYVADLAQVNANAAAKHAEFRMKVPSLSFSTPKFIAPSLQDMLYWANGVEHYSFVTERQTLKSNHKERSQS